jgi:alpha-ketoglutarate-dependent taurine dioxygenase
MKILKLKNVGARLEGFDAQDPLHRESFAKAFREFGLVVFNDPELSAEEHVALMASVGQVTTDRPGPPIAFVDHNPELYKGSGLMGSDPKNFDYGELLFHFDFAFDADWPCHGISLYGITIPPEGGDTLFVHGGDAYARLTAEQKAKVEGRKAVHVYDPQIVKGGIRTREAMLGPDAERGMHDVLYMNPGDGRPALTTAFSTTDRIADIPLHESESLLNGLFEVLYEPEHMLRHQWTVGDFVAWDNHVVQHSRENFDHSQRRTLRRVITGNDIALKDRIMRREANNISSDDSNK